MPVFKTTYTITVFGEFDSLEAAEAVFNNVDEDVVMREIREGDWLGEAGVGDIVEVPPDQLKAELEAIGNDGEFFGELPDDDSEDPDPDYDDQGNLRPGVDH